MKYVTVQERELRQALQKRLALIGSLILSEASEILDSERITYTGNLKRSGEVVFEEDGSVLVWYNVERAPYAWFVEYGRGPGKVPFDPIFRWVVSKLGEVDLKRARNKAWAIVRKIERVGTKPTYFFKRAKDRVIRRLRI